MTDERRYSDDEVQAIFEAAATSGPAGGRSVARSDDGLTLRDLQAIGREVGLPPERVAEAATALDLRDGVLRQETSLGMTIGVARTVALPRAPDDHEWALLITELRATFDARGYDRSAGLIRHWANGNLHAYVEPTVAGHRLRLRTRKGDASGFNAAGLLVLLTSLVFTILIVLTGRVDQAGVFLGPAVFAALGVGLIGGNALRLRGWASERERQMAEVAARAQVLLRTPVPPPAVPTLAPPPADEPR